MSGIIISNQSFYDKDYVKTFARLGPYKHFGIGDSSSTLVPFFLEILEVAIAEKARETFEDLELTDLQTKAIRDVFENKIQESLTARLPITETPSADIFFHGKLYQLDISLLNLGDRKIYDYYKIYKIAEECLDENKPMYLSID
jgi:hypothetical protein